MEKKLKWNAIGFYRKTESLRDALEEEKNLLPDNFSKQLNKINGFIFELEHLLITMNRITTFLIPDLERRLRVSFAIPEMLMIALSRPSIRTIFENIRTYYLDKSNCPINIEELSELASLGDASDVLALIGDAVMDLAVVQIFWDSSIATTGDLTSKRTKLVSNENLARICDKWELYVHKLERLEDPSKQLSKIETINKEKGTLVEAIFGVIYLEFGYEGFLRILPLIQ